MAEPVIQRSIKLPYDHMLTVRATPWTIKRTAFALLPWALVVMTPSGKMKATVRKLATRFSPLLRQRIR